MSLDEVIRGFDPTLPLSRAWMPPSTWYTDPALYRLERTAIFQRSWQPVAHTGQLPPPGSWLGGCLMDVPWLLMRQADGTLQAFHNTCRHKGAVLTNGVGFGEALTCPFHAWVYGLDGRLRRAPRLGAIEDFDRDAMSLPPMGLALWGPLVMVHPDPAAPPPEVQLPELSAMLAGSGWAELQHVATGRYTIASNWKVFVDNYLDGGYHIDHMHPTLSAQLSMESYRTLTFERSSVQRSDGATEESDLVDFDITERMGAEALYGWIYPSFTINRYGPGMDTNLVIPTGPESCEVVFDFYFPPGTDPDFIAASVRQSDITQKEDVAICAAVQQGLRSPSYDRGRYAPRWEIGELHFHRLLAADYAAALEEQRETG